MMGFHTEEMRISIFKCGSLGATLGKERGEYEEG